MQIRRQVKAGRVFAMSVEEFQNFAAEGQYTFYQDTTTTGSIQNDLGIDAHPGTKAHGPAEPKLAEFDKRFEHELGMLGGPFCGDF